MNRTTNTAKRTPGTEKLAMILVAIATTAFGTLGLAQGASESGPNTSRITLRVYDYAHVDQKALRAAEAEADRILNLAGLTTQWVDCPTKHADVEKYPACATVAQSSEFILRLLSDSMTQAQEKSQDALGNATDCDPGACLVSVYYDRIKGQSGGDVVPSYVLTGRVMAREIGQLLIGITYQSRSGIMCSMWTFRQLGPMATPKMLFSSVEANAMKARLAEHEEAAARHSAETGLGQLSQVR